MSTLQAKLDAYGISADEFQDVIQEVKAFLFPCWSVDEMLCHHEDVGVYLRVVRTKLNSQGLPDHLILKSLVNLRKSGNLMGV